MGAGQRVESKLFGVLTIAKHLPGKHDQKSHGRRGGGGEKAPKNTSGKLDKSPKGAAPSAGLDKPLKVRGDDKTIVSDAAAAKMYMQKVAYYDEKLDKESRGSDSGDKASFTEKRDVGELDISRGTRKKWKKSVLQNLTADTGLDFARVSDLVEAWSDSSNDNNPNSLGLQAAANDEFGAPLTAWQKDRIGTVSSKEFKAAREDGRKVLRAMYNRTQKELAAAGIEEVTLYRGFIGSDKKKKGSTEIISENAMESWTLSHSVASSFADSYTGSGGGGVKKRVYGDVYQAVIPRERILSIPKTGLGCITEFEFTVLGSAAKDTVKVVGRGKSGR